MKNHFVPRHKAQQAEPQNQSVEINGKDVPLFGNLDNNDLAVVDLNVLTRLAKMLPKAHIRVIIENHVQKLRELDKALYSGEVEKEQGLNAFTEILESELRFHRTINQIKLFAGIEEKVDEMVDEDQAVS